MKLTLASALLVGLLPLPRPELPSFHPAKGQRIEREWTREVTQTVTVFETRMGDQEKRVEDPGIEDKERSRVVVVDELVAVEDGRVSELVRRFETLERNVAHKLPDPNGPKGATLTGETREVCDLEGKSVRFQARGEDEWKKSYVEAKGADEEQLELLEPDMDLVALLPKDEAQRERGWQIPIEVFKRSGLRPGGRLRFHGERPRLALQDRLSDAAWESIEGKVEASWEAEREEDGRALFVIALEGKLKLSADGGKQGDEAGPDAISVRGELEFEGELLWDKRAQRAHALVLRWENEMVTSEKARLPRKEGGEVELERKRTIAEKESTKLTFREL